MTDFNNSSAHPQHRSFLTAIGNAWREGFQGMPFGRWRSQVPVRLLHENGTSSFWLSDGNVQREVVQGRTSDANLVAVECPEKILLRCFAKLPEMTSSQVFDAAHLAAIEASPFAPDDLVWGYRSLTGAANVEIALASRRHVEAFLQTVTQVDVKVVPMVWALGEDQMPIVLNGFGESALNRRAARGMYFLFGSLALMVLTAIGIAITPLIRANLIAKDASIAFDQLRQQAGPAVRKREELSVKAEKVAALIKLTGDAIDPARLISRLTELLPDDTSLISLSATGSKVNIYGQTPNAAALMQRLSSQDGIRDVKAPVAAVRPNGAAKDTFTIEFVMAVRPLEAASAARPEMAASAPSVAIGASAPLVAASGGISPSAAPTSSAPASGASEPGGARPSPTRIDAVPVNPAPKSAPPPIKPAPSKGGASFGGATFGGTATRQAQP